MCAERLREVGAAAARAGRAGAAIAIVLKGYPRLSETFIAQEIRALERRGLRLRLVSLRHPTDRARHPVHEEIEAPVRYLPEYLHREPRRVLAGLRAATRRAGLRPALRAWLRDLRRDPTRNRLRRFGQALVLAAEIEPDVVHLHAHFMHTPTSVARYASLLLGVGFSFSAHARDIWTTPDWEKREKILDARFAVTCTRHNVEHLARLCERPVDLVYHGIDLTRFPPARVVGSSERDARSPAAEVRLLSVGRAVEKKGYDVLLEALAALPPDLHWRLDHVGDGPLLEALKSRAERLGLGDRVRWHGAEPQTRVLDRYRSADLFVLSSRVAADGDRDGLPNVLMEAQSQRLACIASDLSGVPELIEDGRTGVLVPPADAAALAHALARVMTEPALRARLAASGERRVRDRFSMHGNIERLVAHLERAIEAGRARAA